MQEFELIIGDDIVAWTNRSGYIDSPIYFRVGDQSFPTEGWTDLTFPLLTVWCEDLLRMPQKEGGIFEMPFLDGPFWLEVENRGEQLAVQGRSSRASYRADFSFSCSRAAFFAAILKAFTRLEKLIYQNPKVAPELQAEVKRTFHHYRTIIRSSEPVTPIRVRRSGANEGTFP